jgi:hypothetical protein
MRGEAMSGVWNRNGYVEIPVTQERIDESLERSSSHCATAEAIATAIPAARHISVDLQTIRFSYRNLRYVFLTPHAARDIIIAVDQGQRDQIRPTVLRMRPAYIIKSGKKRKHTPSNDDLKAAGLKLWRNKQQLHLSKETWCDTGFPLQRLTATGERNLSPDRSDGLMFRPKRRPRVARAMVSSAAKGDVPTTLGGSLPPVSILSRREFGLRMLRK